MVDVEFMKCSMWVNEKLKIFYSVKLRRLSKSKKKTNFQ